MAPWICATCAVEHAERSDVCLICADERQWVPAGGTSWTTLAELAAAGHRNTVTELEPGLHAVETRPGVGIGQQAKLLSTQAGSLLWDPVGFIDDASVAAVRALGDVVAVVASHPHMYGVQVEWSRALGGVPVLVAEADLGWVRRPDPVIRPWSGRLELLPGVTLLQIGGHFPGSAVVHWAHGAAGRGVLLAGDSVFPNPDRVTISFMRSFPNRIPLSAAVVGRIADALSALAFDRVYGNFTNVIASGAHAVLRRSADRHIGWVRGDFDHLT